MGTFCREMCNKSSTGAEMGDRSTTIDIGPKVGLLCPFPLGELGPHRIIVQVGSKWPTWSVTTLHCVLKKHLAFYNF